MHEGLASLGTIGLAFGLRAARLAAGMTFALYHQESGGLLDLGRCDGIDVEDERGKRARWEDGWSREGEIRSRDGCAAKYGQWCSRRR